MKKVADCIRTITGFACSYYTTPQDYIKNCDTFRNITKIDGTASEYYIFLTVFSSDDWVAESRRNGNYDEFARFCKHKLGLNTYSDFEIQSKTGVNLFELFYSIKLTGIGEGDERSTTVCYPYYIGSVPRGADNLERGFSVNRQLYCERFKHYEEYCFPKYTVKCPSCGANNMLRNAPMGRKVAVSCPNCKRTFNASVPIQRQSVDNPVKSGNVSKGKQIKSTGTKKKYPKYRPFLPVILILVWLIGVGALVDSSNEALVIFTLVMIVFIIWCCCANSKAKRSPEYLAKKSKKKHNRRGEACLSPSIISD